jgi:hypothetical protein
MQDLTLVVMAAGMGSRFGGPKQVTPVGSHGEFIIDYSIYDAIQAGFTKVVFIIKKEHRDIFRETIDKRIGNKIKIEYVYQELQDIPINIEIPSERVKPWGTDHAILSAKNNIEGPFTIINADDFYGRDAYLKSVKFLTESTNPQEGAVISYPYGVTSSKFGSVKRAVLDLEGDNVIELTESKITTEGNIGKCVPIDGSKPFDIELDHPVSMNLFCFKKEFLKLIEEDFIDFLKDEKNLKEGEALIPNTVKRYLKSGDLKLKNVVSSGLWTGVTYKEDLPELQTTINKLIKDGEYPDNLWDI